jgi:hypothetical protein
VISPAELIQRVRDGLQMPPDMFPVPLESFERFQVLDPDRKLVAIAHVEGNRVIYDRVFAA